MSDTQHNHKVLVMNQFAEQMAKTGADIAQSGLAHAGLKPADNSAQGPDSDDSAKVTLTENPVVGLLVIRVAQHQETVSAALQTMIGLALSDRLQSNSNDLYCVRWMAPDSWLLSGPLDQMFSLEQGLRDRVATHIAIVNTSGGYCVLQLSGERAREVLMKSVPYDVHSDHLPVGKVVNTTFAKTQVTLRCMDTNEYELIVRRSYSDYVWLWLQRASTEYGLRAVSIV